MLTTFHILLHFIFHDIIRQIYYYPYFLDEAIESERPRSLPEATQKVAESRPEAVLPCTVVPAGHRGQEAGILLSSVPRGGCWEGGHAGTLWAGSGCRLLTTAASREYEHADAHCQGLTEKGPKRGRKGRL